MSIVHDAINLAKEEIAAGNDPLEKIATNREWKYLNPFAVDHLARGHKLHWIKDVAKWVDAKTGKRVDF